MPRSTAAALHFAAWAAWAGTFAFYFGVVAPTARAVLGDPPTVGLVTQQVSWWFLGAALVLAATAARPAWSAWGRGARAAWLAWTATTVAQIVLHPLLDQHLSAATAAHLDRPQFRPLHHVYLALALAQWGAGLWLGWAQARRAGRD